MNFDADDFDEHDFDVGKPVAPPVFTNRYVTNDYGRVRIGRRNISRRGR